MALDSYSNLRTGVQEFLTRADATTARVDYFIDLAESWLNQKLRVREMETTNGSLTVSNGLITHPGDWLEWKNIGYTVGGVRTQLRPATLEQRAQFDDGTTGPPTSYIVRGGSTLLSPRPDASYTYDGTYYQKVPALSDSQTTNWVLTNYEDVYFFGCLAASAMLFRDDRLPIWQDQFASGVSGIDGASKRTHGQVMTMRTDSPVV